MSLSPFALLPLHVRALLLLYRVLPIEFFQPVIDFVKRSVTSENNAAWDDPASEVVSSHLEWVREFNLSRPSANPYFQRCSIFLWDKEQ